jgi:uncharacterized protein with FMN-binding domain
MDTDTPKQPNKALIAIVVVAVLAIVTAAIIFLSNKKDNSAPSPSSNTTATTTQPSTSNSQSSNASYKDGTYTESGSYQSPGGTETVDLTVTLKGGVITDTNLTNHPATRDSEDYQSRFIDGYKSLVVGKKVDAVSLSRVSGSSLTSGGFNQALDKIKSDAKA